MQNTDLLEPAKLYKLELKDKHHENVVNYFDELVKKANIDTEANNVTCSKLHKEQNSLEKEEKSLTKIGFFSFLVGFLFVAAMISLIAGILIINSKKMSLWKNYFQTLLHSLQPLLSIH